MRDLDYEPPVSAAALHRLDSAIGIELAEPAGMVTLRAELDDPTARSAIARVTGCTLPKALRMESSDGRSLLWMSPDELLLVCGREEVTGILDRAANAFAGAHFAAVDVSDARTRYRLTGKSVREVLAKGTPVDLHREAFTPGTVRRTRIAQVAAAICQMDGEEEVFEVQCHRSYAPYLGAWLLEAARDDSMPPRA